METPSSTTRVTSSQTQSKKFEVCEMNATKSMEKTGRKQKNQAALIDITNESPIIGLAKTSYFETPSSAMSKKMVNSKVNIGTPSSGEALLRDQVRTLLDKVEEEAEFPKISQENKQFHHFYGFVNSPINILAPTPANTPQIADFSDSQIMELASVTPVEDKLIIPQMGNGFFEGHKDLVTKSLLFEFSEKVDDSKLFSDYDDEDDDSSVWSIEVNVSSRKDELEDDEEVIETPMDELCEGLSNINFAKKTGKHMRFVYDSEEETALHS
ncbi:isomerase [Lithospermum erythrorhizon]|uniref:Isomerase n=1 Tax=Lithospermum erythrorhizon TaxID=34254 RepID=A0AAV3PLT6_LITER